MKAFSPDETRLLRSLLRDNGVEPSGFQACAGSDSVQVTALGIAVCYPADGWARRFVQHLRLGFFATAIRSAWTGTQRP